MAQTTRQQMPRVAESFAGCSPQVGSAGSPHSLAAGFRALACQPAAVLSAVPWPGGHASPSLTCILPPS